MSESAGLSTGSHSGSSVSKQVLDKIAEHTDRDVDKLESPLYNYIDPDALDDLFAHSNGQIVHVEFQYENIQIVVQSDDEIDVREADLE